MTIPEPVDAGYFPKRTVKRPEWLKASEVEEICSVSLCISDGPSDWIQKWLHNDLGFYDMQALAWQVVGPERTGFEMFAYRVYPLMFTEGEATAWQVPTHPTLDLSRFEFLGFDLANKTVGVSNFECSPLSCNGGAENFPVNKFCLMEELTAAYEACTAVSKGEYEPGPYHLLQVYRRKPGG
jgi:hypothetical protein